MPEVPASTAAALMRETLAALDTCLTTLQRIGEQVRRYVEETSAEHQLLRRFVTDLDSGTEETLSSVIGPGQSGNLVIDREAMYRDELALQQEVHSLQMLEGKLEYLANMVQSGQAQLEGSAPASALAASGPVEAAVRAARIEAQEEERARLAREVHDGPAQVLSNAILGLEYCEMVASRAPQELDAELRRLRSMLRESLIEVRRFMFDLRPTMIANMGLNTTLQRYVEDFQRAFGISIDLSLPPQDLDIVDRAQIVIFQVVQESLQNVQKHARATWVRIELRPLPDHTVRLRIHDNGAGFDPRAVRPTNRSGAGLLSMEERATIVGGHLSVDSAVGRGTTITLELPPQFTAEPAHHGSNPHRSLDNGREDSSAYSSGLNS